MTWRALSVWPYAVDAASLESILALLDRGAKVDYETRDGSTPLIRAVVHGWAVLVDPLSPTLKAPGTKRLKLIYDELLSSFAFKFNLRRYTTATSR